MRVYRALGNPLHLSLDLNLNLAHVGADAGVAFGVCGGIGASANASAAPSAGGSSYTPISKSSKNNKKDKIPRRAGKQISKPKHGNKDRIIAASSAAEEKEVSKAKGTKKKGPPKKKRKNACKIRLAALDEENEWLEKAIAEIEEKHGHLLAEEDTA